MATTTIEVGPVLDLTGDPRRRRRERRVRVLFFVAASVSVLVSVLIVTSLVGRAFEFISQIEPSWLLGRTWAPRSNDFSMLAIFSASLVIGGIAMLVAAPLGLGAAIYLSEYARPRARRTLKPTLELLAGVPSIVIAYFALTVISPNLVQVLFPSAGLFNMAAAGIGVGILTVPLIATIAEDAMHAVPLSMREASYGLGARRRTTSLQIVVPAAISGIVAALILGLSRAIGETMVVAIAAGGTGNGSMTFDPLQPGVTATAAMATLATGTDQVKGAGPAFASLFFVGLLLFVATLCLNIASERFVRRMRQRY
jgi:phosphate transport system permease protein